MTAPLLSNQAGLSPPRTIMKNTLRKLLVLGACIFFHSQVSVLGAISLNGVPFNIDTLQSFPAGPGAMYYQLRMTRVSDGYGRIDAWLLTVDTKNPYVGIEEVLGRDAVIGTERPSAMAVRKTTPTKVFYGGVNGDFFATSGDVGRPTGLTILNREFAYTQAATGHRIGAVDEELRGVVGNAFTYSGKLMLPDTTLTIKHVNYTRKENELVLYNQHNAATTLTNAYGTELGVELVPGYEWHTNGTVRLVVTRKEDGVGNMAIPAGQAVLSGHGTMAEQLRQVNIGDTVSVKFALKIDDVAYNISQSIGADNYCLIVDNGRPVESGFWNELHPRTAFGHTLDRDTLLFLVVDGRGKSAGCNTRALGEMMAHYGAHRAVNWDGGGSSCLYIRPFGQVNQGSDGSERAVCNAMFAVANVPEDDQTIAAIAPECMVYNLPRYGLLKPRFLGYNRYGVLVNTDVQGVTLSCDPVVGEVLEDGRFLASGMNGGQVTASLGDVSMSFPVRLISSAPVSIRLDSVLIDMTHPYEVEVEAQVGNFAIQLLSSALTWQSLDESVAMVDANGLLSGVANGTTQVIGSLGDFADTIQVRVQIPSSRELIWDDFHNTADWTITSTKGFEPAFVFPEDAPEEANLNFTYVIGRSPFLKLTRTSAPLFSLPDTIRIPLTSSADISKVLVGIRPNNASATQSIQLFNSGVPTATRVCLDISVADVFGTDPAIFPLWFDYINFNIATSTSASAHSILMEGIRLIYDVEEEETALNTWSQTASGVDKRIENGVLVIIKNGVRYNILGMKL